MGTINSQYADFLFLLADHIPGSSQTNYCVFRNCNSELPRRTQQEGKSSLRSQKKKSFDHSKIKSKSFLNLYTYTTFPKY